MNEIYNVRIQVNQCFNYDVYSSSNDVGRQVAKQLCNFIVYRIG